MMPRLSLQVIFLFLPAIPPLYASSIQTQPPEKIFAANCATCHGAHGLGGASWVDGWRAPWIAGASRRVVVDTVRSGSMPSMPAFAREQITDEELRALAKFIEENRDGIPAPKPPAGTAVVVDILDA